MSQKFAVVEVETDWYGSVSDIQWVGMYYSKEEAEKIAADRYDRYVVEVK